MNPNTTPIHTKVLDWLQQRPKIRILMCAVSGVVGLVFYCLSSSFNHLLEELIWREIVPYILLSLIFILFEVLLTKPLHRSEAIVVIVLVATFVYTYFVDEIAEVKPDAYILVSYAAFSIMSLFLSTLSHIGFEVELLYFFTGTFIIQLMKIKWWLVFFGWAFMDLLVVRLRPTLDPAFERINSDVAPDVNNQHSQGTGLMGRILVSHASSSQGVTEGNSGNTPSNSPGDDPSRMSLLGAGISSSQEVTGVSPGNEEGMARFMHCIKALQKENDRVADHVFQSIGANADLVDKTLVIESLPLEDLHESAQLMMKAGLEAKCLEEYTSWRREFLDIILLLFPSPDLNMEDIENGEKIEGWVRTLTIAVRILFPNERTLCERVFGSHYFPYSALADVFKKSATRLIVSSYALSTWSHCKPDTLPQLLQELETTFWHLPGESSALIIDQLNKVQFVQNNFGYFKNTLSNDTDTDGIHPLTRQVMNYIGDQFKKMDDSVLGRCFEKYATAAKQGKGKLSPSPLVEGTIELLESNLEATSKSYKRPSLGYVFIMINRTFIAREIERFGLERIIGPDWIQDNQKKIKENLQLYLDSPWSQILDFLKVEDDDNDLILKDCSYLRDSMEDNLSSFNEHFDQVCKDKSMWFVFDDKLRDQIIKSIKNMLLPAYENFFYRFPYTNYRVIKVPEPRFVEDRLNKLFLERADESDAGREPKKDV